MDERQETGNAPLITLLVCTYNDETTIGPVLDAIGKLTYRPLEVVVIDDASTDRTSAIVERYPVTSVHNQSNQGLGYNQNLGLRMAKGEFLALVQSDCEVFQPDWLDQMITLMKMDVDVVVSQREIHDFASLPAGARHFNAVAPQDLANHSGRPRELQYCRGKADLYRISTLRKLNGWSRMFFTAGEDTDLSIRLRSNGGQILLHPTASVRYLFSARQASVLGALRKAFLYGKMAFPLYRLHRYDGIQARTYTTLLISSAVLLLPPALQAVAGLTLLAYSFTCKIAVHLYSGKRQTGTPAATNLETISLGLMASIASVPMLMLHSFNYAIPAEALAVTGAMYTTYLAAKNTIRNYRKGEKPARLPGTFLFCIAWRLISGAGYMAGAFESLRKNRTSLEKHESLTDQST